MFASYTIHTRHTPPSKHIQSTIANHGKIFDISSLIRHKQTRSQPHARDVFAPEASSFSNYSRKKKLFQFKFLRMYKHEHLQIEKWCDAFGKTIPCLQSLFNPSSLVAFVSSFGIVVLPGKFHM